MKYVAVIYGTRPEQIKLNPILKLLKNNNIPTLNLYTGQQKLSDVYDTINLHAYSVAPLPARQGILMQRLSGMLTKKDVCAIIVQGDTLSAYCGALCGFMLNIPVFHIEAGLRTYNLKSPFPEEYLRQEITRIASYHFAPTKQAYKNLLKENVSKDTIYLTGNTIVDAVKEHMKTRETEKENEVLITCHRKENIEHLQGIVTAVGKLAEKYPDITFRWIKHSNTKVLGAISEYLPTCDNFKYIKALTYEEMQAKMNNVRFIMTDSGGIQEEAALLKVPTFVLRDTTERPESIESGACRLIGTEHSKIIEEVTKYIEGKSPFKIKACESYGTESPSMKIVDTIIKFYDKENTQC